MMKEETNDGSGVFNNWARPCDTCQSAACTVYCRADSAYLCSGCDARVHAANLVASRHERVWVCEACERAPAAFLCKADAASLCSSCDSDIHSANPLARRHQRVPIPPISGCAQGEQRRRGVTSAAETEDGFIAPEADGDEAASWLLLNPGRDGTYQNNGLLFGEEEDEYLDLEEYNSTAETQFADQYNQSHQSYSTQQKNNGIDCVVPIQNGDTKYQLQQQQQNLQFSTEYESSKTAYSYNGSISNSVSISSLDTGVVPESTVSEISIIHARPPKGTIDLFSGSSAQVPPQLTPLDREARVLRYREKKKNRKFEKTIRYASRKAYAETRPRIKGRFAKRTDVEVEVDQMFSTAMITENGYSIVPSF